MDERIKAINSRLAAAGLPVRLRQHGQSLSLQATSPVKSGEGRKQQEISLRLKISVAGLKRAESDAHTLARHLINGTFDWSLYRRQQTDSQQEPETAASVITRFRADYLANNQIQESTWEEYWKPTLARLPQHVPLSGAAMLAVVLATPNHTSILARIPL